MTPSSWRIRDFERAAARDPKTAVKELTRDLTAAGGPLIEPLEGDDQRLLVTFVWIGADGPVSIRGSQLFADLFAPSHVVTRVEGTNVWHASTIVTSDVVTLYQYVVDDPYLSVDRAELLRDPLHVMRVQAERSYADSFNQRGSIHRRR